MSLLLLMLLLLQRPHRFKAYVTAQDERYIGVHKITHYVYCVSVYLTGRFYLHNNPNSQLILRSE